MSEENQVGANLEGYLRADEIAEISKTYFDLKKPLYPRQLLERIVELRSKYKSNGYSEDLILEVPTYVDGKGRPARIIIDQHTAGNSVYFLQYYPIQRLLNPFLTMRRTKEGGFAPAKTMLYPLEKGEKCADINIEGHTEQGLHEFYRRHRQIWDSSKTRQSIEEVFRSVSKELKAIKKIILFAASSITEEYLSGPSDEEHCDGNLTVWPYDATRIVSQHAVVGEITTMIGNNVACFAQEPSYQPWDVNLLRSLNIVVLDDPAGLLEVDETTLVMSTAPSFPLLQILAELEHPAMIFVDEIALNEKWADYTTSRDPDTRAGWPKTGMLLNPSSPRVKEMIHGNYEEIPVDDTDWWFCGDTQKLYVRKS